MHSLLTKRSRTGSVGTRTAEEFNRSPLLHSRRCGTPQTAISFNAAKGWGRLRRQGKKQRRTHPSAHVHESSQQLQLWGNIACSARLSAWKLCGLPQTIQGAPMSPYSSSARWAACMCSAERDVRCSSSSSCTQLPRVQGADHWHKRSRYAFSSQARHTQSPAGLQEAEGPWRSARKLVPHRDAHKQVHARQQGKAGRAWKAQRPMMSAC